MDSPHPAQTDPRRRIALVAAVYLGSFIATLDVSIVNVALPTLQRALATDLAGLQWVIDIYALCLSAFILSAGPVGDRYGRKRAWLAGVVVFTLGSAMCAMAGNLSTLLAGRAVQGVAGALMIPGALSLLAHAFPEPVSRARVIGGWSSFTALSLILGPMLGGLLVDHAGWQSIFLINLPIGAADRGTRALGHPRELAPGACGARSARADAQRAVARRADLWIDRGRRIRLGFRPRRGCAGRRSRRSCAVPDRGGARGAAAAAARAVSRCALLGHQFRFLRARLLVVCEPVLLLALPATGAGLVASDTGWRLVPQFVATGLVASQFGRLVRRFDVHTLMVAGYALIGASMLLLTLFSADTPYVLLALLFVFLGAGTGLAVPSTSMAVMASVPAQRSGMASATMNALRQAGMLIGIALLGTLMSTRATALLATALEQAGLRDAQQAAVAAVSRHDPAALAALDADTAHTFVAGALAGGFHAAMVCACGRVAGGGAACASGARRVAGARLRLRIAMPAAPVPMRRAASDTHRSP
jgi:DHA2 family methylenomycin A resistance protein-like MFS transporter